MVADSTGGLGLCPGLLQGPGRVSRQTLKWFPMQLAVELAALENLLHTDLVGVPSRLKQTTRG